MASKMGPKRGDLEPKLVIDVADLNNPPANLTLVTSWRIVGRLRGASGAPLFVDAAPTIIPDPGGSTSKLALQHTWVAGQTDTPGVIELEVEATWPGGRPQHFPNGSFDSITIADTID